LAEIRPVEGDILNYTHVLFRWDQEAEAVTYQLQAALFDTTGGIDPFQTFLVVDLIDSSLAALVTDRFDWGQAYVWHTRPIDDEGEPGDWSESFHFSTESLPDAVPDMIMTIDDTTLVQPGLTITNLQRESVLLAVDLSGNPVFFLSQPPAVTRNLPFSEIISDGTFLTNKNIMTLDNEVMWVPPENPHHATLVMPSGNIMALTNYTRLEYIPEGPWTADFDTAGIDSVLWKVDRIVEWDRDGNEVWSWDAFDHFSTLDYDSATFALAFGTNYYDWTHANALDYDPADSAIYLCVRHLDRIAKIDYRTGDVVWSMGRAMPSGDVQVGNNLAFSYPHSAEVLDNGNLILYDNGNFNIPQISRGIEIGLTETDSFPTAERVWEYVLPESLYTATQGDCDRLPNGNTLLTVANPADRSLTGRIFEINTDDSTLIWQLQLGPNGGRQMFGSERIPGLYPQAYCLMQPDFAPGFAEPTIFLAAGDTTLEFRIYNKGWMDETYSYDLTDDEGWFAASGSITVNAGEYVVISVPGTVAFETYPNTISFTIIPEQAPADAETASMVAYTILSTDPSDRDDLPKAFALGLAYPNPFNPTTVIPFSLPQASHVQLIVYDMLGRETDRIVDNFYPAGNHRIVWEPPMNASGVYIVRMEAGGYSGTRKVILLK
jgi:hypothetical protein